ncbi:MAG: ROK family protein [Chloroflexi bacterium]|nr:ROK family protein [Chloroflexota bacterium]
MAPAKSTSLVAGVDLGGTKVRAAVITTDGKVLGDSVLPTPAQNGPEAVVQTIADAVRESCQRAWTVPAALEAIGLAAAGLCDQKRGVVVYSPNLPGWDNFPVSERLFRRLERPTFLDNDVNLAALAEQRFGAARGHRNVVYIAIGTGIGGAIIINGELHRGETGIAAEVGHMTVAPDGPPCACANRGCLEALSSGSALAREARLLLQRGVASSLAELARGEDYTAITSEAIFAALAQSDALAREVAEQGTYYLGTGLASLVNIFNPGLLIVGGGLADQWEDYIAPALRVMEQRVLPGMARSLSVVPPALGSEAGVQGAAAYARERLMAKSR